MVNRVWVGAFLALTGCAGAAFTGQLNPPDDPMGQGDPDSGSASSSSPASSSSSSSSMTSDADGSPTSHDAGVAPGSDSGPEAAPPPTCLSDLSGVGVGDFHIGFTLQTTAGSIDMALLNQRTGCNETSTWWDVSYIPSTATQGALQVATCDGTTSSYVVLEQGTGAHPDDGQPHRIVVSRVAGQIRYTLDGALVAGPIPDAYDFGAFAPLRVATDDCPGFGATVGTVTDVCITVP